MGDQFIDVDVESEAAAQEQAFAKLVRSLSPAQFIAWETGPADEWAEDKSA